MSRVWTSNLVQLLESVSMDFLEDSYRRVRNSFEEKKRRANMLMDRIRTKIEEIRRELIEKLKVKLQIEGCLEDEHCSRELFALASDLDTYRRVYREIESLLERLSFSYSIHLRYLKNLLTIKKHEKVLKEYGLWDELRVIDQEVLGLALRAVEIDDKNVVEQIKEILEVLKNRERIERIREVLK